MPTKTIQKRAASVRVLSLPMSLAGVLALFCFVPRAQANRTLELSIGLAVLALLVFAGLLRQRVLRSGRALTIEYLPKRVHYVQLAMHSALFAYWGFYWREVYHYVPLILAQIIFAYALDMLVCWSRRDKWIAGFGPIPIILSTNLFLWFRDDWFLLQFIMISIGVVAKEYVTWKRDGRNAHIFNPSAVGLFIFSVILIATKSTSITWGEQIAVTLHQPPNIYLEIFVLGLVVQALFSVTLVTLSAGTMLYVMNMLYTHTTGVYQFIDSGIPVSVFIGIHLLVTDPATSPRSNSGKVIFGGLYGMCVFGLYSLLSTMGAPRFYDKLLCVPLLNLSVRWLDRIGGSLDDSAVRLMQRVHAPRLLWAGSPQQKNLAFMSIWVVLFGVMITTGFLATGAVGKTHPGSDPAFWEQACDAHLHKACTTWVGILDAQCEDGHAGACLTEGRVMDAGMVVPRDPEVAGRGLGRACDLKEPGACQAFVKFVSEGGDAAMAQSCDHGDAYNCFYLGTVLHLGGGVAQDDERALRVFQVSCNKGYVRACGVLGDMYLAGEGAPANPAKALANYETSCSAHWGESCASAGLLYHRGTAGTQDEALSQRRFEEGCELGFKPACGYVAGRGAMSPMTP
jgi:Na+-translocating ferredoxin:NAD+ oxidoreductase RnfD subunit